MAKTSKLTLKQEKFCQLYAATGNATQSFKDAGYSVKTQNAAGVRAHSLLKNNSNVKARLRELAEETKTQAIADIREMQETLTKIIREELDEEMLMTEGCGDGYSQVVSKRKKAALKERLKAIELLGKMQGGFIDKVQIDTAEPVKFVEDLSE